MRLFFKMSFVKFLLILIIAAAHGFLFFKVSNAQDCADNCTAGTVFLRENAYFVLYSITPFEYLNSYLAKYGETVPPEIMKPLTYASYVLLLFGFIFIWYMISSVLLLPFRLIISYFKKPAPAPEQPAAD